MPLHLRSWGVGVPLESPSQRPGMMADSSTEDPLGPKVAPDLTSTHTYCWRRAYSHIWGGHGTRSRTGCFRVCCLEERSFPLRPHALAPAPWRPSPSVLWPPHSSVFVSFHSQCEKPSWTRGLGGAGQGLWCLLCGGALGRRHLRVPMVSYLSCW